MTLYVDRLQNQASFIYGPEMNEPRTLCRLYGRDLAELHAFASSIGLKAWQFVELAEVPHYVLRSRERHKALDEENYTGECRTMGDETGTHWREILAENNDWLCNTTAGQEKLFRINLHRLVRIMMGESVHEGVLARQKFELMRWQFADWLDERDRGPEVLLTRAQWRLTRRLDGANVWHVPVVRDKVCSSWMVNCTNEKWLLSFAPRTLRVMKSPDPRPRELYLKMSQLLYRTRETTIQNDTSKHSLGLCALFVSEPAGLFV